MRWPWRRRPREPPGPEPVPDDSPHDPSRILQALDRHGVDYLLIGGMAVQTHGHVRTTRDVDILANPDPDNLARLGGALRDLHARLKGVDAHLLGIDPGDPTALAEGANFGLATLGGTLDVWTDPAELKGAAPWHELRARALEVTVGGRSVRVVGRDDLIRMKQAAGRPRDIADIAALTEPRADRREDSGHRHADDPPSSPRRA